MIERLKVISTNSILTCESPCPARVDKIADEISREGKLRNPLLVSRLDDDFLLLDNASVLQALVALNVDHVPVQIAAVDEVSIRPWQRLIADLSKDDLISFCGKLPRKMYLIEANDDGPAPNQLEVRFLSGARLRLMIQTESVLVRADICNRLHRDISRRHKMYRSKINYRSEDPFRGFPEASAILFPPIFSLDELAYIARHDEYLPHGYIRPDQPGRVLGIDFSLSVLMAKDSLEEKESFLRDMLKLRLSLDRIAYYNGAVFVYNN